MSKSAISRAAKAAKPDHPEQVEARDGEAVLKVEVAHYIAEMSEEMSRMAKASGHHLLSYFLDMAAAEARSASEKAAPEAFKA